MLVLLLINVFNWISKHRVNSRPRFRLYHACTSLLFQMPLANYISRVYNHQQIYRSEKFFKNILLYMNSRVSKIRSLHMYVLNRTVFFDWVCIRSNINFFFDLYVAIATWNSNENRWLVAYALLWDLYFCFGALVLYERRIILFLHIRWSIFSCLLYKSCSHLSCVFLAHMPH